MNTDASQLKRRTKFRGRLLAIVYVVIIIGLAIAMGRSARSWQALLAVASLPACAGFVLGLPPALRNPRPTLVLVYLIALPLVGFLSMGAFGALILYGLAGLF